MPRVIFAPPDPAIQAILDLVRRKREEQLRKEAEREEERAAQKQRLIAGVGVAAGAVGGAFVGPALGATVATGALQGASVGGRIGQQFATGDIAGGVSTAAGAARGIMQSFDDQRFFGGPLTTKERGLFTQRIVKAGFTMSQLKGLANQGDATIPELLQVAELEQADDKQFRTFLTREGLGQFSPNEIDEAAIEHPQGRHGVINDLLGTQADLEADAAGIKTYEQRRQQFKAEVDNFAQLAGGLENLPSRQQVSERDHRIEDINDSVLSGDMSPEQGVEALERLGAPPRVVATPRRTPPTVQEKVNKDLAVHRFDMGDGTLSPPAVVRFHPPTPRDPEGSTEFVRFVSEEDDLSEALLKHQVEMSKAEFRFVPMDEVATSLFEARRIAKELDAGTFVPIQRGGNGVVQPSRGGGQSAPTVAPTAQQPVGTFQPLGGRLQIGQGPPPPDAGAQPQTEGAAAGLEKATNMLEKAITTEPDLAKWPPELRERLVPAAAFLNKRFLEKLRRGEQLTPDEVEIGRLAERIIRGG